MSRTEEESLRELLARVHERLSQAGNLDPEARELLITLTRDIERTLGVRRSQREATADPRGADHAGRVQHLEALAASFEAVHPSLAQLLRQIVDVLVKGGF